MENKRIANLSRPKIKDDSESLVECLMWELAHLSPKETGLKRIVWVGPKSHFERCSPRVKVQARRGGKISSIDWVSVSISFKPVILDGDPKVISSDWKDICAWITLNRVVLLKYWKSEISTKDFVNVFKAIK